MSSLPTGTVTFLFTDIEGSTRLWQDHPAAAQVALVRHDVLVEQIVAEHAGHVVRPRGEGDSRFAVFERATDAMAAAAALQQAFFAETWSMPAPLRVRMALHTGEADLREGDYYGNAVNRCARLRAVAHGGQTLVSLATQELARDALPPGAELHDLGAHRLKDLARPEHIFQLIVPSLPAGFPPLKSLDARPHNLPVHRNPLVGREREVIEVVALLQRPEIGLVTLTGPGGTGKTRLSQQVAAELLDNFPDGIWFVDLAPIVDAALVPSAIAQVLGIGELPGVTLTTTLSSFLRNKRLLLVLDNFEQVVMAAPLVSNLLRMASLLKVLVTSREVLRLSGEQEYPVLPLALPDPDRHEPLARLSQYAAVQLFIQRAQASRPDFQVTNTNAPAVAEICVRLDGLPLAIELAAARIKVLPPAALLTRLDNRLNVLTGGTRDQVARQRTLRGTIDWSYSLLSIDEQALFQRLGVFVGGWTLEAAEAICPTVGDLELQINILDGIQSLTDKSLVRHLEGTASDPRFFMLETIREYALERIEGNGGAERLRLQHALFYVTLTEQAEPESTGPQQQVWLQRLDEERGNLWAVLHWSLAHGEVELGLRMAAVLSWFWRIIGYGSELRHWLDVALERSDAVAAGVRAKALNATGLLTRDQGNFTRAQMLLEESLAIFRDLGDTPNVAVALRGLGSIAERRSELTQAIMLYEESLAVAQSAQDKPDMVLALHELGYVALRQGDDLVAARYCEEALVLHHELGNKEGIAHALHSLATLAQQQGNIAEARRLVQESLALSRELRNKVGMANGLINLGWLCRLQGDYEDAQRFLEESLSLYREVGNKGGIAHALSVLGSVASYSGNYEVAQQCFQESIVLNREVGDKEGVAFALTGLGYSVCLQGDYPAAIGPLEESVALLRDLDRKNVLANVLLSLALAELAQGDYRRTRALLKESMRLAEQLGDPSFIAADWLLGMGALTGAQQQPERAVRLFSASDGIYALRGASQAPVERAFNEHYLTAAQVQLDKATFATAWAEGRAMTLEQAIAYALEQDEETADRAPL